MPDQEEEGVVTKSQRAVLGSILIAASLEMHSWRIQEEGFECKADEPLWVMGAVVLHVVLC